MTELWFGMQWRRFMAWEHLKRWGNARESAGGQDVGQDSERGGPGVTFRNQASKLRCHTHYCVGDTYSCCHTHLCGSHMQLLSYSCCHTHYCVGQLLVTVGHCCVGQLLVTVGHFCMGQWVCGNTCPVYLCYKVNPGVSEYGNCKLHSLPLRHGTHAIGSLTSYRRMLLRHFC